MRALEARSSTQPGSSASGGSIGFGRESGGKPLARGALYLMLQNRIYRGEIVHKDASYPGEHEAIVDEELWQKVQDLLAENRVERRTGAMPPSRACLPGCSSTMPASG